MNHGSAVVTGASAGIGTAYARRLAQRGHHVVLVARREERLRALADELGFGAEVLVADLARPEGVAIVAERLARPDVGLLVNNAGISGYGPLAEADPAVLAAVLQVNAVAPTLLTRAALPGMIERGGGAIVNVASLLAFSGSLPPGPLPHRATYAGTKAHVVVFSRVLAGELQGTGVRVQVCCPGRTATEFHAVQGADPLHVVPGDLAQEPAEMSAEDVVTASLVALDRGEVVCIPGLDDPTALERLTAVEAELRRGSRRELAQRYRG
jgi:short-subunit dehydrogenase